MKLLLLAALLVSTSRLAFAQDADRYPLIPWPSSLIAVNGDLYIDKHTPVIIESAPGQFDNELTFLQTMLRRFLGPDALPTRRGITATYRSGSIVLQDDSTLLAPESYRLWITGHRIYLAAHSPAGMFYAIQTLRQLLPAAIEGDHGSRLRLPCVEIADQPAFPWRGMMLDASRHFFSTDYLRKFIDRMAMYKFNRLHLHLTDDQGWRIEIKKYPRLTTEGGWRTFNDQDSACMKLARETDNPDFDIDPAHIRHLNGKTLYGGFYTQVEMKAIIRYAAARHIEIIPEVDMPGHMMAAILRYPELTCDGKKGEDRRDGFSTPICPCKDSALQFAKNVFSEIADLFPSRYIHIGGDEVEKSEWKRSPLCTRFMQDHHLNSLEELQSYFNDYMEAFFRSRGKTLVGWDEIIQGGIDSAAVVMFWRAWEKMAPLKATRNGNKVIMTADGPLYFDAWPDRNALNAVYHYDPTDPIYGMDAAQRQNILGVQANLWTERVPTTNRADYLVMPRMTALAELGWTHRDLYNSYLQRLDRQYDRLDRLHIPYCLPALPEVREQRVFTDTASFFIASPTPKLTVRYALDGFPKATSLKLTHPLIIDRTRVLRFAAFTPTGRRGDLHTISFERQAYAPALTPISPAPGLQCSLFRGTFDKTAGIQGHPDSTMIVADATIPAPTISIPAFGLKFRGYINVPETGIYSFFLTSDDGSVLRIANRLEVDNDGEHSSMEKSGQVALQKGPHTFALDYLQHGGGYALQLNYSRDNNEPQPVPASWYEH